MSSSFRVDKAAKLVRGQLAVNSISGVVQFAIVSAVYLMTYPVLLKSLGPAAFGLWALLGLPSQYVMLGSFGLSNALIKLLSEDPFSDDKPRATELAGSAAAIFIVIGAALLAAAFAWRVPIIEWLHVNAILVVDARILLIGMAGVVFLSLLASVYLSVLSGLHRMDLANIVQTFGSALTGVGILVVLKLGGGLVSLLLVNTASAAIVLIVAVLLARCVGEMHWTVTPAIRWRTMRALLGFGMQVYVAALFAMLLEPTIKTVLSRFAGLEDVSNFEIASRVLMQGRSLFVNLIMPLLPVSSLLMSDNKAIREVFGRAMRLLWLTAIPLFLGLAAISQPLLKAWFRTPMPACATILSLLAVGWLVNILALPPYIFVQGMNVPRHAMVSSVLQGLLSVAGAIILIPRFGLIGAAYCEVPALTIGALYVFWGFTRLCPIRFRDVLPIRPSRAFGVPLVFVTVLWLVAGSSRTASTLRVAIVCVVAFAMYASFLFTRGANGFTALDVFGSYFRRSRASESIEGRLPNEDECAAQLMPKGLGADD